MADNHSSKSNSKAINSTLFRAVDTFTIVLNSTDYKLPKKFLNDLDIDLLILIDNSLTKLDPEPFNGIKSIRNLYLSNNKFRSINFQNFTLNFTDNLESLILKNNSLELIPDLTRFSNLNYLDLSYNIIQTINDTVFLNLTRLETLDLSNNYLDKLDLSFFSNSIKSSLEKFSLDFNFIEILFSFENFTSLNDLSLSFNRIKYIDNCTFFYSENLKQLDLSYNKISKLHNSAFRSLSKLTKLDLSYNYLNSLHEDNFKDLIKLEKLWLQYNYFKQINLNHFKSLSLLNMLDLSNNDIERVIFNEEHNNFPSVKMLRLSSNKLSSIDFLKMFHNLKILYLNNNYLSKIPNDITNLIKLDVSNQNGRLKYLGDYAFTRKFNNKYLIKINISGNPELLIKNKTFCLNDNYKLDNSFLDLFISKSTLANTNRCIIKQLAHKFRRTRVFVVNDTVPLKQNNAHIDDICKCDFRLYLANFNILIRDFCPRYKTYCFDEEFHDDCISQTQFDC